MLTFVTQQAPSFPSSPFSLVCLIGCHDTFCSNAGAHVCLLDSAQHVPDPEVPGCPGHCDISGWQSNAGPAGSQEVRLGTDQAPGWDKSCLYRHWQPSSETTKLCGRMIGTLRGKSDTFIQPVRKTIIRSFKEESNLSDQW